MLSPFCGLGKDLFLPSPDLILSSDTSALAATYLHMYRSASEQLAKFRPRLESTSYMLLADSMCERLEGGEKQRIRTELIRLIGSFAVRQTSLQGEGSKQKGYDS